MPHVPFAKCSDRPETVTSDFICLFLWLGNRSLQLSARQGPVAEGPAHRSRSKDEPAQRPEERAGQGGSAAASSRADGLAGPVILLPLRSLAEATPQLPFAVS